MNKWLPIGDNYILYEVQVNTKIENLMEDPSKSFQR